MSEIEIQSARGSIWNRWDPHIHTPGTALNDQYIGEAAWNTFLSKIESAKPPIRALGITDYFSIERYTQVRDQQRDGRLPGVGLIFPNVELRLSIETSKASAINLHLLFDPDPHDHVERIRRFLLELEFTYRGNNYRCQNADLIRLGRAFRPGLTDDEAALSEGANQFKVNFEQLRGAWKKTNGSGVTLSLLLLEARKMELPVYAMMPGLSPPCAGKSKVSPVSSLVLRQDKSIFGSVKAPPLCRGLRVNGMDASRAYMGQMHMMLLASGSRIRSAAAGLRGT